MNEDAAIASICARQGFKDKWPADLAELQYRHESEQDPGNYPLGPMHDDWPHELNGT